MMSDDNNFIPETEEYKSQEDGDMGEHSDGAGLGSTPPSAGGAAKASARGRRLFIPLVLLVAIILIYQLLSWYSNKKGMDNIKQEELAAQKNAQSLVASPIVVSSSVAPNITPGPTKLGALDVNGGMSAGGSRTDLSVQQKLDVLAARTESNTVQMEKMQDVVGQTKTSLVDLNRTVTNLSGSVQTLNNNVQKLSEEKAKPKKIKKIVKKSPPKEIYHIKAVVPGMAWLESADGKTLAVRVGDELPGYGKVNLISPKQGMVITVSGAVIQYGVNDF